MTITANTKSVLIDSLENVTNFDKYPVLDGVNRKVDQTQVNNLVTSFQAFGTLSSVIVVIETNAFGNGETQRFRADGQHRIVAAELLGIGLAVRVIRLVEDTTMNVSRLISVLNSSNKAWSTLNFLNTFCANDIEEYKTFKSIMKETSLTITDLLNIFTGSGSQKSMNEFKDGRLIFVNEKDSMRMLKAVVMIKGVIPNKAFCRRGIYNILRTSKTYTKTANAIIEASKTITFSENEREFKAQIASIVLGTKLSKVA
jgi:hypothetical protein|tara:strand:+ start:2093 stop:2863 length:771 start_codon:yes stop_codon:yes gene_type:complete